MNCLSGNKMMFKLINNNLLVNSFYFLERETYRQSKKIAYTKNKSLTQYFDVKISPFSETFL